MRRLLPDRADAVDPASVYAEADRPAPLGRPWLLVNMIASADGASSVEGRSGGLGGPADRRAFAALRSLADVILVGAATVRAERYRPPQVAPELAAQRRARGQAAPPQLAVVTASLDLAPDAAIFTDADNPPTLIVPGAGAERARQRFASLGATILPAGAASVDLAKALSALHAGGARLVLCEGGPSLNGQLAALDLIDELCLTVAPVIAAGEAKRIAAGHPAPALRRLRLAQVLEEDSTLLLRYVRLR
ncbi:MAG: pyrimidine reductase family protein [Acidimicrobiales bacterium]